MCETIHRTDKTNDDMAISLDHIKPDNQVDKEFRPPSSGQICVKLSSGLRQLLLQIILFLSIFILDVLLLSNCGALLHLCTSLSVNPFHQVIGLFEGNVNR